MNTYFWPLLAATSLLIINCGGEQAQPETPATVETQAPSATEPAAAESAAAPAAAAAETPSPATWAEASTKDQKIAFMKAHVAPQLGKVFQAYDAAAYKEFGCTTCHGPEYKSPQEFLPRLTLKDGKLTSFVDEPAVSKFMAEKVVGEMATILGKAPYDPKTHQGFGCGGCHAVDMK